MSLMLGLLLGVALGTADGGELRMTAIVRAVQAARPSVVNIHGRKSVSSRQQTGESQQVNGMGTGIVIDERGISSPISCRQGVTSIQVTYTTARP